MSALVGRISFFVYSFMEDKLIVRNKKIYIYLIFLGQRNENGSTRIKSFNFILASSDAGSRGSVAQRGCPWEHPRTPWVARRWYHRNLGAGYVSTAAPPRITIIYDVFIPTFSFLFPSYLLDTLRIIIIIYWFFGFFWTLERAERTALQKK